MYVTANKEVREVLGSDFALVEDKRAFFEDAKERIKRLSGKAKAELKERMASVQTFICQHAFTHNESSVLRLEKYCHLGDESKGNEVRMVVDCHEKHARNPQQLSVPGGRNLVVKLGGRLIVNQAGGVIENAGLCLHRHFGYPMIPGSAVKGAARHAAWCRWAEAESVDEKRRLALKTALTFGFPTGDSMPGRDARREPHAYLDVFLAAEFPDLFHPKSGNLRQLAGAVAFLAAVPRGRAKLVTDIVNCHHMKYYNGERDRATDDESPNPQFFPAVEAGTSFVFAILPIGSRARAVEREYGFSPAEFALEMLQEAVEIHGIGAKTAAGYGWFGEDEEDVKARRLAEIEKQRKAELLAAEREAEERRLRYERQREQERQEREEAERAAVAELQEAAESADLASLPPNPDIRAICGRVKLMLQARDSLDESERAHLAELVANAFATLGKKDSRKLLKTTSGKGRDLWRDLRRWLGDDATEELKREVGAQ